MCMLKYTAHLVEKAVLWSRFYLRKGLGGCYGPELVWYGSADTYCIQ